MKEVAESMKPVTEYANAGFMTYPAAGSDGGNSATKAQKWGDSVFGYNTRFTVYIIDMKTRHLDIYASVPLAGTLTAAEENSIADNVYKYASAGKYTQCAKETFTQIAQVLRGEKLRTPMKYISNAFFAVIAAMLIVFLVVSGLIRKEQATSLPNIIKTVTAGAATVVLANRVVKVVHHESRSGGGGGGHGGGGGGGGGHGGGGSSGGHGF